MPKDQGSNQPTKSSSFSCILITVLATIACLQFAFIIKLNPSLPFSFDPLQSDAPVLSNGTQTLSVNENLDVKRKAKSGYKEKGEGEAGGNQEDEEKLNIVLLYGDDWRYDTLSAAGHPVVKTPNLDRLAKNGVHFTHNCVTTSVCWISRATLYTGQYLSRHKAKRIQGDHNFVGHNWKNTMPGRLLDAGYYTGLIGKWHHYNFTKNMFNFSRLYYGSHWERDFHEGEIHVTKKNERDALEFLRERPRQSKSSESKDGKKNDNPFFLLVSFFATHAEDGNPLQYLPQNESMKLYQNVEVPLGPTTNNPKSWDRLPHFFGDTNEGRIRWKWRHDEPEKHQRMMKNLYRMATEVDTSCGKIIKELEHQGVLNKTLVIFTTDNGNIHGEHGLADKWYPHQESIRVPLIVWDPRMEEEDRGMVSDEFTLNVDLAPTILGAAGGMVGESMQGRDMSELYRKRSRAGGEYDSNVQARVDKEEHKVEWRKEFFYEYPLLSHKDHIPSSEALVRKDFKYVWWPDWGLEQLFDLVKDPFEERDLIGDPKQWHRLVEMRHRFAQLKQEVE